jgi:6-phosphogluconolactonase (cycloisomerase 2 family)
MSIFRDSKSAVEFRISHEKEVTMKKPAVIGVSVLTSCLMLLACGGSNSGNTTGGGGGGSTGTPMYVSNSSSSSVSFYLLDQTAGSLQRQTGSPVSTGGSAPDSLAIDPARKFLFVSNQSSSNISVFNVNSTTAALTAVTGSPFAAGASAARLVVHPKANFVYALSSTPAEILAYSFDSTTGLLAALNGFPVSLSTSGQSGLAISPSGQFLYTSNPNTNVITGFSIGTDGSLTQLTPTTSPSKGSPVFLAFDSSSSFLFAVNAGGTLGGPSVSTLSVSATGALAEVTGSPTTVGTAPVNAVFSQGFLYVLNQTSGTISAFAFTSSTGQLTELKGSPFAVGSHPVSLATAGLGKFLIATTTGSSASGTIAVFSIAADGTLTPVAGSPFTPDTATPDQVLAF